MEIELFTLCDYATNNNGRLTIVNTIDKIVADKFPWRSYFGFAIKGIIKHECPVNADLELSVFEENSEKQLLFHTTTSLLNHTGRFAICGNLRGLIFPKDGKYIFRIKISPDVVKEYVFLVESSIK